MTRISVFEPIRPNVRLRNAIHQLFEDSVLSLPYVTPPAARHQDARNAALDVLEDESSYTVVASLPGVDKDTVEIQFQGEVLSIRTSVARPSCPEGSRWLLRERFSGEVTRTLTLPVPIDADRAEANYRDGVLTLTLPKAESQRPRTIKVHAN